MRYLPSAWRLELFGWLRAYNDEGSVITRFQTHQTGALLAYLALHPNRSHTRDELGDILWPEADVESMRHRFRQALSALRKQLELPGTPHGSILFADRWSVRINMDAVSTDVAAFEETISQAMAEGAPKAKLPLLLRAYELYRGELLPGYYEECFASDKLRLADSYLALLEELVLASKEANDLPQAIVYAKKLIGLDSLREDSHAELIKLYEATGERSSAIRQYQQLKQILQEEIGSDPSPEIQRLYEQIVKSPKTGTARPESAPPVKARRKPSVIKLPAEQLRPRLPLQFTRFFGRDEELQQIVSTLDNQGTKLLTMVGMGGVGKTRLALQAAEACRPIYDDNVYFALLAPIDDPANIVDAIFKALGIKRIAGMSAQQQIAKHLNEFPRVLLVLDNFEHLLPGAGDVRDMLSEVPGLQCLITSRHRLNIEGERLLHLAPLPPPCESWTAADLIKTPRTQILVDRARAVMPDFQVTERNAGTIAEICEKLEGIPLAIELAAAWARILSPSQMLEQLSGRFGMLVSKRPDIDERHRTLRAALGYTYSLLRPELQEFFLQLSTFRGGWTLDAASAICGGEHSVISMDELLDWSLIVSEGMDTEDASEIRCSMLDTIQQYADELLSPEQRADLARRRYGYFLQLIGRSEQDISGAGFKEAIHRLDADGANIAACLRWCEESGHSKQGLAMALPMFPYWVVRAQWNVARDWISKFLCVLEAGAPCILQAEAKYCLARLHVMQGQYEAAIPIYKGLIAEFAALENEVGVAKSLNQLGFCERERGQLASAKGNHEEGLRLARKVCDKALIGSALANLGVVAAKEGNIVRVVELFEESLGLYREMGDRLLLSVTLSNYGFSLLLMNDFERAEPHVAESIEIVRDLGLQATITARINLSYIHLLRGELEPAKELLRDTLLESSRYELRRQLYCCIGQASMIARKEHRYEQSAVLLYAMLSLSQALGLDADDPYLKMADEASAEFRQVLSPVSFALANARGRAIPTKELVEFALASILNGGAVKR
ncbi:MAG TPA: BTAD domain-containing putative transcriptional regulator [Fimbriimonadaceae bacterium]|jgi:predicted ATPase/DNA-binding SARP family transcriptional activator